MNIVKRLWDNYPTLTNWLILAVGMLIILYFGARHVGFDLQQWTALAIATIVLAGLCSWIISWE